MTGTKALLSNFAISGCVKDSVAVRRQSEGHQEVSSAPSLKAVDGMYNGRI